jgi:hypothetical protein
MCFDCCLFVDFVVLVLHVTAVFVTLYERLGTRWRSWLRHCATNRNVAGSIPDGVTGILHLHNRSGRTMALGSTQPLTEMSTRNLSWGGKGGRCVGLTTLPPSCADCLKNLGSSTSWIPRGLSRPIMGLLYLLYEGLIF